MKNSDKLDKALGSIKEKKNQKMPDADSQSGENIPAVEIMDGKSKSEHTQIIQQRLKLVDPKKCRLWKFHDRDPSWFDEKKSALLISQLRKSEQREPALVRSIPNDPDYDYEIIYGARRRFACEFLNKPYLIQVAENLSDKEASILMYQENEGHEDISPMERYLNVYNQILNNVFPTKKELSEELDIPRSTMHRMEKCGAFISQDKIQPFISNLTLISTNLVLTLINDIEENDEIELDKLIESIKIDEKDSVMDDNFIKLLKSYSDKIKFGDNKSLPKKRIKLSEDIKVDISQNKKGCITMIFDDWPNFDENMMASELIDSLKEKYNP
jgi:ParB family chromosome partitioning protein